MHIIADRAVNTPVYLPHCTYVINWNAEVLQQGLGFICKHHVIKMYQKSKKKNILRPYIGLLNFSQYANILFKQIIFLSMFANLQKPIKDILDIYLVFKNALDLTY